MIKVIKNGNVITMDETKKQIEKLDIVIKDDTIVEVCSKYEGNADEVIDASGKIVMPGLINAHTHLGMSYFRATNDNLTLQKWLNDMIWPIENKMDDKDTYLGTLLSIIEMIKTGTTCANDMYFNCEGSIKALKETGFRCMFTRTLMDNDSAGDNRIDEFIKLYEENKKDKLITFSVSPHALYTCNQDYLTKCSELATKLNLPVHIHYCENKDEIEGTLEQYNKSPLSVLIDTGLINNKLILAHATFIDDDSLEYFKGKDITFVTNPVSNLNLGCGIADLVKYRDYVNLAIGTDGQGSGNNLNMFYHMSLVDLLQKGKYENPTVFSSYEVLKMATINGAKALGLEREIGSIKPGKKADIIMLDMNDALTAPGTDIITNVVHNAYSSVSMTMIDGNILMKDKKICLNINEEKLINKIKEVIYSLS